MLSCDAGWGDGVPSCALAAHARLVALTLKEDWLNRKDFLARMEQITDAGPETIRGSEALADLTGWDSLAKVQFQAFLDEDFHLQVSPTKIAACETV